MTQPQDLLLTIGMAPGDTIALSALLRDLGRTGRPIRIGVRGPGQELFTQDPGLSVLDANDPRVRVIEARYASGLRAAWQGIHIHYLQAFHIDFREKTGLEIPFTDPRPHIILTEQEKAEQPFPFRYWLINAGAKSDRLTKRWGRGRFQEVVDRTHGQGVRWVQIGNSKGDDRIHHIGHEPLNNVLYRVDQTPNLRELARLVYHADGVLCGVTMLMLLAAAFWRPCVVVAGGREPWWWQSYSPDNPALSELKERIQVPHRFLHTVGQLDCSRTGCSAGAVVAPHNDSPFPTGYLCSLPTYEPGGQPLPECLSMITADQVVAAVRSYYSDGTLPPL